VMIEKNYTSSICCIFLFYDPSIKNWWSHKSA